MKKNSIIIIATIFLIISCGHLVMPLLTTVNVNPDGTEWLPSSILRTYFVGSLFFSGFAFIGYIMFLWWAFLQSKNDNKEN